VSPPDQQPFISDPIEYLNGKQKILVRLKNAKREKSMGHINIISRVLYFLVFDDIKQDPAEIRDNPCLTWRDTQVTISGLIIGSVTRPLSLLAKVHKGIQTRECIFGPTDPELLMTKYTLAMYYDFEGDWSSSADLLRQIYQALVGKHHLKKEELFYSSIFSYGLCLARLGRQQDLENLKTEYPVIDWEPVYEAK
jgi:hypothetical protein